MGQAPDKASDANMTAWTISNRNVPGKAVQCCCARAIRTASRAGSRFAPGPATSCRPHRVGVFGGNGLVSFETKDKLKDGAPRFIRAGPQLSLVRLDDRTADRQPHAH